MKHDTELFLYDNIYFENGRKDPAEHPVVVVGHDDRDLYCFMMTSQTKHEEKNSPARNMYNQNVKYIRTYPGKNIHCNNNKEGLINTTMCFTIPIEDARLYSNFGYVTSNVARDIVVRWAYQQNEIKDKKDWNYDKICSVFGINDSIKGDAMYKYTVDLMRNYPDEIAKQKQYAKELRIYNETCYKTRKENRLRKANNMQPLAFPSEPHLASDKDYLEAYAHKPESEGNSVFADLAKQFAEKEAAEKAQQAEKEEAQRIANLKQEISNDIIRLQEYKRQMMEANMNYYSQNEQSEQYEENHHIGRRAA